MALRQKVFAVALVGLTTCLASPLSWTHHYVWILPLAVAVLSPGCRAGCGTRRVLGGLGVRLPAAGRAAVRGGRERQYDVLQQLVANLGPMLGVILLVGLAWQLVVTTRAQPIAATASP